MADTEDALPSIEITEDEAMDNPEEIEIASDEEAEDEMDSLPVPAYRRQSRALQELDEKHEWLVELEGGDHPTFITKAQFVALSNKFQRFLEELRQDENQTYVCMQFSAVFEKFRLAYSVTQRMMNKVKELECEKDCMERENDRLLYHIEEGKMALGKLNKELKEAESAMTELSEDKSDLLRELEELKKGLEKSPVIDKGEMVSNEPTIEEIVDAEEQVRDLTERLKVTQKELDFAREREAKLRTKLHASEKEKEDFQTKYNVAKSDLQRQTAQRERAELTVVETRQELEKKCEDAKNLATEVKALKVEFEVSKNKARRLLVEVRGLQKKLDAGAQVTEKLKRDMVLKEDRITNILSQKKAVETDLNEKLAVIHSLKIELSSANKDRKSLIQKVAHLDDKNTELEEKCHRGRAEIASLNKDLEEGEKKLTEAQKKIDDMTKVKEQMTLEILKLEESNTTAKTDLQVSNERCNILVRNLENRRREIERHQDKIKHLVRIKERMAKNVLDLQKTITNLKNEIKTLELRLEDEEKASEKLRKHLEIEMDKNKVLYDDLRTVRKQLTQTKADMGQMQDKMTVLNNYSLQLRGLLKSLENELMDAKSAKAHLDTDNASLRETIKQHAKVKENMNTKLKHSEDYSQQLIKKLTGKERDLENCSKKLSNATDEIDILRSKYNENLEDLKAKNEKLKFQEDEIARQNKLYSERLQDIGLLKVELSQMCRAKSLMTEQVDRLQEVKTELIDVKKDFMDEQLKSKAIEEEVQRPVNLHRWRILEGTDPDRAQLLSRNRSLQKQLLNKTSELDAKELDLREKEQSIVELRKQLLRRTEHQLSEKYVECKQQLKELTDKLKCRTAEVNMYWNLSEKNKVVMDQMQSEVNRLRMTEIKLKKQLKRAKAL